MEGLWRGSLGQAALITTRKRDVTAVAEWEGASWVATRRGLELAQSLTPAP